MEDNKKGRDCQLIYFKIKCIYLIRPIKQKISFIQLSKWKLVFLLNRLRVFILLHRACVSYRIFLTRIVLLPSFPASRHPIIQFGLFRSPHTMTEIFYLSTVIDIFPPPSSSHTEIKCWSIRSGRIYKQVQPKSLHERWIPQSETRPKNIPERHNNKNTNN